MKFLPHRALRFIASSVALVAVIPLASQGLAMERQKPALVETGDFHGDEVHARTGQHWLGLYVSRTGSRLVEVIARVSRVNDPIVDENERQRTGKRIQTPGHPNPVFLVRGFNELRPSDVTTVFAGSTVLTKRTDITLRLGSTKYRLWVSTKDTSDEDYIDSRDASLQLSVDGMRQELYSLRHEEYVNEPNWELIWAGDIDRDGLLDLYVGVGSHYNMTDHRLFLSSSTSNGQIVRQVARLKTLGC